MTTQPASDRPQDRPNNREVEDENMKAGSPPRPATEPAGSGPSQDSPKTKSDPGSGEAH